MKNKLIKNNSILDNTPDIIFDKLNNAKKKYYFYSNAIQEQQKILNKYNIEYIELNSINEICKKKSNYQELIYDYNNPLKIISCNKIYRGKLKVWYHISVDDHKCPSETVPFEIIPVAVKIIEHSDAINNENNEPEMLYYLKNNIEIIKLYGYHLDPIKQKCMIVLEWCDGKDLLDYIMNHAISVKNIKKIIKWLIRIIIKCHRLNICHFDLKLDNIMLLEQDNFDSLRLIDFGTAKFIRDNGCDILYKFIGSSPHYIAPEIINAYYHKLDCAFLKNYKLIGDNLFKVDVWHIGIITYILLHRRFPFNPPDNNNRHIKIFKLIGSCMQPHYNTKKNKFNEIICDNNCIDFLNKLIEFDPDKRITLENALKHKWLQDD